MKYLLLLLLTGCTSYAWVYDGQVTDYYRWVRIERETFPLTCGFVPPDGFNSGGACAIRLKEGVVMPSDKDLATGVLAGEYKVAPLCVIHGTMTEEEAGRMRDKYGEMALDEHEKRHCRGWVHQ